jgi:NADH:ubiquinone oxidoreductase subunit F (NADH-binding)
MTGSTASACAHRPGSPLDPDARPRLLPGQPTGHPASLIEHLERHGPRPSCAGDLQRRQELIDQVGRAGLSGRGGAAFPTAVKLHGVAKAGRAPEVIANGVEGEPASAKDKVLLACAPHLVLDGVASVAELTGADQALIVVHRDVREIVSHAAAERCRAGYDQMPIRVMTAAGGFTAGEASAVVHWVEQGVPTPTGQPPRLGGTGRRACPTLVQNVETLAHVALIVRYGASWFRSAGTSAEPGTMLVTLLGAVQRPGVYEIPAGTPFGELLALAGGASADLSALLIGGYFGTWAEPGIALPLPFSAAGLRPIGAATGAGVVAALPRTACGLAETTRLTRYLAASSAGQCGPCVFGLDAIAGQLERLAAGGSFDLARMSRWLGQVTGRGACRHPDGAALMVASALRVFRPEIELHARGWCSASDPPGALPVPRQVPL